MYLNVLTRGIRNAFRNKTRTFSIIIILGLSVGLALTMLIARQAVGQKISNVKSSVGSTVSVSPAGVRGFEGGGNALTDTQIDGLTKLAHVTGITKTLNDRLTTDNTSLLSSIDAGTLGRRFAQNNGAGDMSGPTRPNGNTMRTFSPPVILVGTSSPSNLSLQQGGGSVKLTSGTLIDGSSSSNVALIGAGLATKNNLKVGSTFTAYGQTVTVAGIFDAGNSFANNQVIMPLITVQTISGQAGAITAATITVDSISNVANVTAATQKALGTAADVTNDSVQAATAIAPLENIKTISLYSLLGAVLAGSVIILLTMIMIVRERRREIGVIKAIGASNVTVVAQFSSEAATLTLLGSLVGIVLGAVAASPITRLLVVSSTSAGTTSGARGFRGAGRHFGGLGRNVTNVSTTVGWEIIVYGLIVALVIAIVGSALASLFIAKIRPAEVLRSE